MNLKLIFIVSFSILFLFTVHGQSSKKDSILQVTKEVNDSTKFWLYMDIAGLTFRSNPDTAINYCLKAAQLAESLNYNKGMGEAYGWLGYLKGNQGFKLEAMDYNSKAVIAFQLTKDRNNLATAWGNLGLNFRELGKLDTALILYHNALDIFEELDKGNKVAGMLINMGSLFIESENYDDAMKYFKKALIIKQELNVKQEEYAVVYNNMAFVYGHQKNDSLCKVYHQKSLDIWSGLNDNAGMAHSISNIANIYKQAGDYDQAMEMQEKSLRLRREINDKSGICLSLINIASIYFKQKKIAKALSNANEALELATEIGSIDEITNVEILLHDIHDKMSNHKEALKHFKNYIVLRDSANNEKNVKLIVQKSMQYEFEKIQEIQKIEQEKKDAIVKEEKAQQEFTLYATAGILFLVLVFAGFIFNRFKVTSRQKKIIEFEQEKSENLLLNILPASTSKELKQNGKVEPQFYKQATVLFTDFKGFTMVSEELSPKALVTELDYIFKEFDRIIAKYPIEKIKTIGDAYMACGGIPEANNTNPLDMILAALEINDFMKDYAAKRAQDNLPFFEVRIGIHTGPLVAGVVGEKKFAYDIWGDTVNTASRMESSGEAGRVNISGETHQFIVNNSEFDVASQELVFENRGKIKAKNKGEIEMLFVANTRKMQTGS